MNTVQYKCPNCGGELVFNPEKQMFSCPYCASDFTEAEMEERYHTQNETAQKEADADAKTLKDENDEAAFEEHTRLYECPSCGAQIIADETTSATFCYYCHNPVVLAGRLKGNYKPAYVLPFAVQRDAAEKEFRAWCRKRWFLPSDFRSKQQLEKMSGVYVPFWLASCVADTDMSGVGQVVKSWRDGKYQVTETTEYTVSRQAKIPFERVPADGAAKIEDALMDAIEAEAGSGATLKKLKADVRSLRIRLQALNADAATTAEETAHAIQLLLAQASVDTSALSEQINKLITAALNAGLKTDPLPLRDHLERYLQLAELNRTVSERVSAEAALLESVEQAAGDPDADAAWQQVKELWSHELSTLRTALAGSVLSTRTKHMETIDELTRQILEGISIYCIHAACEIRRQIAQSRASSAKAESAA